MREGGEDLGSVSLRGLCNAVQRAGYKSGNIRKLEACVKVYGAVAGIQPLGTGAEEGEYGREMGRMVDEGEGRGAEEVGGVDGASVAEGAEGRGG